MNCFSSFGCVSLVQGDTVSLDIKIDKNDEIDIKTIWFTSESVPIKKQFSRKRIEDDGAAIWTLYISSYETAKYPSGGTTYDITIEKNNGDYITRLYNGWLLINEKLNGVIDDMDTNNNYLDLTNLPQINGITLSGNMTAKELYLLSSILDDYETATSSSLDDFYSILLGSKIMKIPFSEIKGTKIRIVKEIPEDMSIGDYIFLEK